MQRDEGFWFELTHEYLVEEIVRWVSAKEKELKKVWELLEQAVRNHRNLGILMPMAQIRLIRAQEDELHLSKEERQLLRDSEAAVRSRHKTVAIASAAAAVVLLICGSDLALPVSALAYFHSTPGSGADSVQLR